MNAILFLAFALLMAPPPEAERLATRAIQRDSIVAESALTLASRAFTQVAIPEQYTAEYRMRPHPAETHLVNFLETPPRDRCSPEFFVIPASCPMDIQGTIDVYTYICLEIQKENPNWNLVSSFSQILAAFGC